MHKFYYMSSLASPLNFGLLSELSVGALGGSLWGAGYVGTKAALGESSGNISKELAANAAGGAAAGAGIYVGTGLLKRFRR